MLTTQATFVYLSIIPRKTPNVKGIQLQSDKLVRFRNKSNKKIVLLDQTWEKL